MILLASAWDITGKPIDCCVPSFFALELRLEDFHLDFGLAAGLDETEGEVKSKGDRDIEIAWQVEMSHMQVDQTLIFMVWM